MHRPPAGRRAQPPDIGEPITSKLVTINSTSAVRIELVPIHGRLCLSLRRMWREEDGTEWRPTKKGLAIGARHARAIADAAAEIAARVESIAEGEK
jgi:hypothetical protein